MSTIEDGKEIHIAKNAVGVMISPRGGVTQIIVDGEDESDKGLKEGSNKMKNIVSLISLIVAVFILAIVVSIAIRFNII